VRRANVRDLARPAPRGPHDLHRGRPDAVFTVRTCATRRDYESRRRPNPLVRKSAIR
jgi:hypothetical protein